MTGTARIIHSDPDILGGTPVFVGTRVPVKTLLDYLEGGDRLDEFLDDFPTVTRCAGDCGSRTGQGDAGNPCV